MLRKVSTDCIRRMATSGFVHKVQHDGKNKVFYVELPEAKKAGSRAVLEYETLKNGALDLYHTEVPPELRGQGIAALLVKTAFDHCVSNKLKMRLTCTYVKKYYDENTLPEYTTQVVQ